MDEWRNGRRTSLRNWRLRCKSSSLFSSIFKLPSGSFFVLRHRTGNLLSLSQITEFYPTGILTRTALVSSPTIQGSLFSSIFELPSGSFFVLRHRTGNLLSLSQITEFYPTGILTRTALVSSPTIQGSLFSSIFELPSGSFFVLRHRTGNLLSLSQIISSATVKNQKLRHSEVL